MIITIIFTILLFVLLTPSILVRLPKKGNKYTVAFVHGLLFAIIYHFTHKMVYNFGHKEKFTLYKDANCTTLTNLPMSKMYNISDISANTGELFYYGVNTKKCTPARFGTKPK